MDPDWTDPCAVLTWLRPKYYAVLAGLQEVKILYGGRETTYNLASADKLAALMRQLEDECARKSGAPTRRRAIVAG